MPWLKNNAGLLQLKFYFHSFGHFFWLWWHCTHQNILLNLGTWLHRCNKVRRGKKNDQPCSQTGCKQAKGQARLSKVCASEMSVIIPHYTTTATTVDQSWTQKLVDKLWWMVATDSLGSILLFISKSILIICLKAVWWFDCLCFFLPCFQILEINLGSIIMNDGLNYEQNIKVIINEIYPWSSKSIFTIRPLFFPLIFLFHILSLSVIKQKPLGLSVSVCCCWCPRLSSKGAPWRKLHINASAKTGSEVLIKEAEQVMTPGQWFTDASLVIYGDGEK